MIYKVNETFYSLKGEGVWTGTPMYFIRLAGCNVNCEWCDTDYSCKKGMTEVELVEEVLRSPAERVVITGGEPGLQDTVPLVVALHSCHFKVHLETNGTIPQHTLWDWIAVSPKSPIDQLDPITMRIASEIKFIVGIPGWQQYIAEVCNKFKHPFPLKLWVMPLAKPYPLQLSDGLIDENIKEAVQYCLDNPTLSLCMQQHKVLGIK